MCRTIPTLSIFYFFINKRFARASNALGNTFRHVAKASNHSGNDFRQARKRQTIREMTFARRGNAKPFGKRLSPSAEMPNPSGNNFRQARKCQTFREMTFVKRGNAKSFRKLPLRETLFCAIFCSSARADAPFFYFWVFRPRPTNQLILVNAFGTWSITPLQGDRFPEVSRYKR